MSPDYREKYKEYVRKKYCLPEDGNHSYVAQVPPNEKYTEVIIGSKKERGNEILNRPWRHTQLLSEQWPATTIDALFESDYDEPQTVVLLGVAGVGKTTMTRKIMLDWATGRQFPERFDSIFYLSCQQMNLIVGETNLADLVLQNDPEPRLKEAMNELIMNPGKCLFIIDGFEELSCSIEQQEDNLSPDPWERMSVGLLLSSLFHKTLLPESCLIITTRPNALESLENCLQSPCYVRHLGLSEGGKKEYFHRFFGEEELAVQVLSYIKRNEALLAISFVPTVCRIICTVMKQQLDKAKKDLSPVSERLTAVYALYLSHLAGSLCSGSEQLDLIRRVCSLAADAIWKKKTLFKEEELPNQLALCSTLFQKNPDCEGIYNFIHPTVQEFLAALFYVFEDMSRNSETAKEDIKIFLDACSKGQGDLTLTVQFVFGLLNKEIMEYLKEQFEWNISSRIKAVLLEWFQVDTWIRFICPNYGQLERFHSLYEIREDKEFVKCALNHLMNLTLERLTFTQMDKVVLCFCIKNCLNLETLSLYRCSFLMDKSEAAALPALPNQPCQQHQKTEEQSPIHLLCQTLMDPNCKIKKVELDGCQFTERCWVDLSVVLSTSPALVELDLQMTNLKDSGVRLLCEGLIHPNCKLEKLGLGGCDLTHACCGDLSTVLSHSQTLMELQLAWNSSLGVQGVQLLCQGLKHPACKLQSLDLDECGLIAASCQDLIPVLSTSKTLRKLNLERNKLGDAGVKLLCEGLKHPQCQLQTLLLTNCELGPACCGDLCSVLSTSQTLTELDLEYNQLEDFGVRLLCEGLKQPNCKLEKLGLAHCGITAASCGDLASVVTVKQTLKELVIEFNQLGDSGVKLLCEGLKHPLCKLETLNLFNCELTAVCTEDLASVLSSSQTLTELLLGSNALGDSGMKQLCEGLKHPHCKMQKLCLCTTGITAAGCVELSSVLSTSQVLKDIDLWENPLEDSGVRLLCEGMKHPDCKLEVLSLDTEELSEDTVRELSYLKRMKPELVIDT
ncbi:NACHT, LRR and PYD domains-containing protein 12 isoform X2 [Sceloporus undulatus]|uniref:NACHT, LRR and PYD domains-containing protein 12 isoform X2 n=1 Tax=Sceloporus undulatus TaxID=8520 RepID=UPI001C4C433F|nr:NACHT, LRR and PYD domains-containing protein 12 isoform X2 [Sceloporus undulatus]